MHPIKRFEPITRSFKSPYEGSSDGITIHLTLSEKGIRIFVTYDEKSTLAAPYQGGIRFEKDDHKLLPNAVEELLLGYSSWHDFNWTFPSHYGRDSATCSVHLSCHDQDITARVWDVQHTVFDLLDIAMWWNCVGFPNVLKHQKIYGMLKDVRAAHLISPPPQEQPEPELVEPEIIEAEFEFPNDSPPSEENNTNIVVVEHVLEKHQESLTGLGLRRMAKSAANFARDVAVDVVSRTISRVMTGQQ